jgi:hypothetical protein
VSPSPRSTSAAKVAASQLGRAVECAAEKCRVLACERDEIQSDEERARHWISENLLVKALDSRHDGRVATQSCE